MSLARTALRLAAVAALEADPIIAALCPGRVFDSRIDALDASDPVPVIVVFTEDDNGRPWSHNNGGPPFDHACELMLEISMRVCVPDTDGDVVMIGMAETDAEAEAAIDLLEECAVAAVTIADTPQARLIRQAVTRRATELKSVRFATADAGSKLALRTVTLTTHLKISQPDARDMPSGPFASLPEPLRAVAASLSPASSAYAICLALAAKLPPAIVAPAMMSGMDVTIQPQRLTADQVPSQSDRTASVPIVARMDLS